MCHRAIQVLVHDADPIAQLQDMHLGLIVKMIDDFH
jgi:hypothetical protein